VSSTRPWSAPRWRGGEGERPASRAPIRGRTTLATTGNPAFSNELFTNYDQVYGQPQSAVMTLQGTIGKTFALLAILSATAIYSWNATADGRLQGIVIPAAGIGGFILALITIFRPTISPWTAPIYAAFEGVFLGALSALIEAHVTTIKGVPQGIAIQAVSLTACTMFIMLFVYATGLIRVTDQLRAGIVAATGAICLVYLVSMVLGMFGYNVPFLRGASTVSIGFSVFVVGLAAFNLLLDFDMIDQACRHEAPKYMEWYGAFGLMVTLIWLYLEILRLLSKLQERR
jgi:uncharacterized YccA/Bax inhibitor family protein